MNVYLDGDSCKKEAREIVVKRAFKGSFSLYIVSDRLINIQETDHINFVLVERAPDAADLWIRERVKDEDLVITRDIPLAADLVKKGITVLNDRGILFTKENVEARLKERDEALKWRNLGISGQGEVTYDEKDKQNFANGFDKILVKMLRK